MGSITSEFFRKFEIAAISALEPIQERQFKHESVELDGKRFMSRSFVGCTLNYSDGDVEFGPGRTVDDCRPIFSGPARRAVLLLRALGLLTICAAMCPSAIFAGQTQQPAAARVEQSLDGNNWRLGSFAMDQGQSAGAAEEKFDDSQFRQVQVPGEVQLQLGLKGMDLFRQTKELVGINYKEWWYRKYFRPVRQEAGKRVLLTFDGVDYFASVWLNGKLLGEHEGTYVPFSFDVTSLLRYDADNVLAVRVTHPWIPAGRGLDEYMNGNFSMSVYSNTLTLDHPPYSVSVGWDALPAHGNAAFAMGIWRSVSLITVDTVTLADLYVRTVSLAADGSAQLAISGALDNAGTEPVAKSVELSVRPVTFAGETLNLPVIPLVARPGKTPFNLQVKVNHAHLWWTWDHGAQDLYELQAQVVSPGSSARQDSNGDSQEIRFGIRTLTRDSDMTYRLNGVRIFIKASWFPIADYYRSRPTRETYERDLHLFRGANLNLLVNFTVVEKPEFYDLCDALGILIVVELPFPQFGPGPALAADSPRRQPFLEQAEKQVTQIVIEHRNHPAIVEWAPLAESHDQNGAWGFGGFLFDQSGYQDFINHMQELISGLAPGAVFHPSLCDLGEKHFWMATAGYRGDSGDYQQHFDARAGFVSEYGGISMSSYEKLGEYLTPREQWEAENRTEPRWFGLPIDISAYAYLSSSEYDGLYSMLYRTEHYVDQDVRSPRDLVDDTQIYQAFILKYATEAYRRRKYDPIMGIRFWDFVELAPGFRFGIVDYDRVPKVSYWWMKRAEAPLAVNFAYRDALESQVAGSKLSIPVWAINDLDHSVDGKVECGIYGLHGDKVFSQSFAAKIPANGKAVAGQIDWTLPEQPGVYVLRANLSSSRPEDHAEDTTFIKVVPRAFSRPLRVLLIAQSKYAAPIAAMLRGAGIDVDVRDEEAIGRFQELANGPALHAKYAVIWLASFENFAKIFDAGAAEAVKQAVAAGTGFIHTGGESSYHGGNARQSLLETTPLADLLPVTIQQRDDLVFGEHTLDDALQTETGFKDISAASGDQWQSLPLLQHYGVPAFNLVSPNPNARTLLLIHGHPLLVEGDYGQGRSVSFTGFTPADSEKDGYLLGQQLIRHPANRSYFETFIELVALAARENPALPVQQLLAAMEKPLFQDLKESPRTQIHVEIEPSEGTDAQPAGRRQLRLTNGTSYAHLVRLRMEWDPQSPQPTLTQFSDNAFELLPGEEKMVNLSWILPAGAKLPSGTLTVDGSNVSPSEVHLDAP